MLHNMKRASLLALLSRIGLTVAIPHPTQPAPNGQPDYVIIGGGPAGFVLAEQLSKNPKVNVLLLEAGPDTAGVENIDDPGLAPLLLQTPYTWNYTCQPDPNLNGIEPYLHQGRGFGGGSAVNYLGHCRGSPSVFDEWAKISKDDGLKWKNFENDYKSVAYYKETPLDYDPHVNKSAYGNGPIEFTSPSENLGFVLSLIESWKNVLKIPQVDLNDGTGVGISTGLTGIRASNHTRVFASQAYGWPMNGRPNARQLHDAEVTKIGFEGKRAVSVTYVNPITNATTTLRPKEIIVAAGALGSPKLLMLSGVGPAKQLKSHGIPVVADIPQIGKNLFDHHFAWMEFEVPPGVETLWQYTLNATFKDKAAADFKTEGKGPLGVPNGAAFAVSRIPDEAFSGVKSTFHTSLPADRGHLLFQYSSSTLRSDGPNVSTISPFVAVIQPEAAGYMELASSDYRDQPLIHPNYYGSESDKAAILYGYKQLRKVVTDPALSPVLLKEVYPGANVTSDEDLWKAIQKASLTFHHPLGTVALGTVVEGKTWRIKGLQGIRVIDSSTFPSAPTCHTMHTVYAYAYHAAQLIKMQDKF